VISRHRVLSQRPQTHSFISREVTQPGKHRWISPSPAPAHKPTPQLRRNSYRVLPPHGCDAFCNFAPDEPQVNSNIYETLISKACAPTPTLDDISIQNSDHISTLPGLWHLAAAPLLSVGMGRRWEAAQLRCLLARPASWERKGRPEPGQPHEHRLARLSPSAGSPPILQYSPLPVPIRIPPFSPAWAGAVHHPFDHQPPASARLTIRLLHRRHLPPLSC